jgi:hypothetical protein
MVAAARPGPAGGGVRTETDAFAGWGTGVVASGDSLSVHDRSLVI